MIARLGSGPRFMKTKKMRCVEYYPWFLHEKTSPSGVASKPRQQKFALSFE
jgi:hypothetical protein